MSGTGGKTLSESDMGIIRQAMALRVKYRSTQKKQRINISFLGVHPKNRGSVYPQQETVKNLGVNLLSWGFSQEEADHAGLCVEEIPMADRPALYESYTVWNKKHCVGAELLDTCFVGTDAMYGTLSHSHLLLVLLCWSSGARWGLVDEDGNPRYCNQDKSLDIAAVAASQNAVEMLSVIKEGLAMEVLSWKIYLEEPKGCSLISHAFNRGSEAALRSTELTALSVLTGEIALQKNRSLGQEVAFESVRDAVRQELDVVVDEPEFLELFEFVISLGGSCNSFVAELLDFGQKFVDQKKRQLRLHAFVEVNKMKPEFPRAKIAVIKRAYRRKPLFGFCPMPEPKWSSSAYADMERLEHLLHYFHVDCKAAVAAGRNDTAVAAFFGNVDFCACEAFYHSAERDLVKNLLAATSKYYFQLQEGSMKAPAANVDWIKFEAPKVQAAAVAAAKLKPKLLVFDEPSGALINSQDVRSSKSQSATVATLLPWRTWLDSARSKELAANAAAMAAAAQVVHMLHLDRNVRDDPFNVFYDTTSKLVQVKVTEDVEALHLSLPPCIPKQSKVFEKSEHPYRVPIHVFRRTVPSSAVAGLESTPPEPTGYRATFYLNPEWKGPADTTTEAQRADAAFVDPIWSWTGDETMHPFWAVRRLTAGQLNSEPASRKGGSFNCELIEKSFSVVCVGSCKDTPVSCTFEVTLPMLTNLVSVKKNAELLLEIAPKTTPAKRKETWKDDVQKSKKDAKKSPAVEAKGTVGKVDGFLDI